MQHAYHREEAERGPMVLERVDDLDEARRLLGEFTDIRGMSVVNPKGNTVGQVVNLYMDPKQEKLVMAEISFGGVWGFGVKRTLVPMDQLQMVDDHHLRVITTPEIVKAAPEFQESQGGDWMKYHDYWCQAVEPAKSELAGEGERITSVVVEEEEE